MIHLFHSWGRWQTIPAKQWWNWSDGTTSHTPMLLQYKECTRCGKRKTSKL